MRQFSLLANLTASSSECAEGTPTPRGRRGASYSSSSAVLQLLNSTLIWRATAPPKRNAGRRRADTRLPVSGAPASRQRADREQNEGNDGFKESESHFLVGFDFEIYERRRPHPESWSVALKMRFTHFVTASSRHVSDIVWLRPLCIRPDTLSGWSAHP